MAKQKKEEDFKKVSLDDLVSVINKKYKGVKLKRASSSRALSVPRLETGIFALDYAVGGGLPVGRITGIFGKKSSGKTLVALKTIASAQRYCSQHLVKMVDTKKRLYRCLECGYRGEKEGSTCPDCKEAGYESKLFDMGDVEVQCPVCKEYKPFETVWIDAEGAWENSWAAKQGVNCHHLYLIRSEFAEQAIDIADILIRNGKCNLFVVDTLAHLIPSAEISESAENWQMGLQARLINKFFRKTVSALNAPNLNLDTRPTVLVLNQLRMKIGLVFGDPEVKPGGMGQEFAVSVDVKMWPGKYVKDDAGNTLNLVTNFRVVKNKVSPPQQEGNFRLWLRDVDGHKVGDTEDFAVVMGTAFKHGWFGEFDEENPDKTPTGGWSYKEQKFKSKDDVVAFFKKDRDAYEELRTGMFSDMLGTIASDEDAMEIEDEQADKEDEE